MAESTGLRSGELGGHMSGAMKVIVGLASHWPRVRDISGSPPTGSRPISEHPPMLSSRVR